MDVGCGQGLVGIYMAKCISPKQVYMTDIDPLAVQVSTGTLRLNEIEDVTLVMGNSYEAIERSDFTIILSNPPYHTDLSVAKIFIEFE